MTAFIKFVDSVGILIALSSPDGVITYANSTGKKILRCLDSSLVIGQSIFPALKKPERLDLFKNRSIAALESTEVEVETTNNFTLLARLITTSIPAPIGINRAPQVAFSPHHCTSSLARAIYESQVDDLSAYEEEMSFNDCFDNAAMERM